MRWLVALLVVVGLFAAVERAIDSVEVLASGPPADVSEGDKRKFAILAEQLGVRPGSAEYAKAYREMRAAGETFYRFPLTILLHVVAGALFLASAALQFSARVRARHPAVHRWNGRILLALAALFTLTGFFFGVAKPYGGSVETAATLLFGGFLLYSGLRAWLHIRRREVRAHREWMIRMFATALGIATVRLMGLVTLFFLAPGVEILTPQAFAQSLWLGWSLTLLAAELWIRATRRAAAPPLQRAADGRAKGRDAGILLAGK
jgi:uncharacterized membrane protein